MSNTKKVEKMFYEYLNKSGLNESKLHPVQFTETKRAFFAGVGSMMIVLESEVSQLPDEQGFKILDNIQTEIGQFYVDEVRKQN